MTSADSWTAEMVRMVGGLDRAENLAAVVGKHEDRLCVLSFAPLKRTVYQFPRQMNDLDDAGFDFVIDVNLQGFGPCHLQCSSRRCLRFTSTLTSNFAGIMHCLRAEVNAIEGKRGSTIITACTSSVARRVMQLASPEHGVLRLTRWHERRRSAGRESLRYFGVCPFFLTSCAQFIGSTLAI